MNLKSKFVFPVMAGCLMVVVSVCLVATRSGPKTKKVESRNFAPRVERERDHAGNPGKEGGAAARPLEMPDSIKDKSGLVKSIEKLLEQPYSDKRQRELSNRCKALGGLLGVEESMSIIGEMIGPGRDRKWMMAAATSGSKEPISEVIRFTRTIEYSDDYQACMSGLTAYIRNNPFPDSAELRELAPLSRGEVREILSGMGTTGFTTVEHQRDQIKIATSFIKDHVAAPEMTSVLTDYFGALSKVAPSSALTAWIECMDANNLSYARQDSQGIILSAAFRRNPEAAAEAISARLAAGNPEEKGQLLASALRQWLYIDMNSAVEWISGEEIQNPKIKSIALTPLFDKALKGGDLETARKWAELMNDSATRAAAEARLSAATKR